MTNNHTGLTKEQLMTLSRSLLREFCILPDGDISSDMVIECLRFPPEPEDDHPGACDSLQADALATHLASCWTPQDWGYLRARAQFLGPWL